MKSDLGNHIHFYESPSTLPFKMALAGIHVSNADTNWQQNRLENGYSEFGHTVLKEVCNTIGYNELNLCKEESGRPYGILPDGKKIELSVSHTSDTLWCAVSPGNRIGIDAELVSRKVSDRLRNRMLHPDEHFTLRLNSIRLWTIKESILKLFGTGLRTNMSSIAVKRITEELFESHINKKTIRCVSVEIDSHWISVAYYH
ncbi:MAG: 4'-phosphopantetheinyl transferase superfamily protein [Bacteroidetes bacterium]|nr:4'-phosphopantetheinyl transferase superfamily protein [Bacteroidota bacterium]MCH8523865.1 4'-phosphopantetheinyl transferase superfamily protein [Balneolales bacterium]